MRIFYYSTILFNLLEISVLDVVVGVRLGLLTALETGTGASLLSAGLSTCLLVHFL
jgi:hypothetical protein